MFFIQQLQRRSVLPQRSPQPPCDRRPQPLAKPDARAAIARVRSHYFLERRSVL